MPTYLQLILYIGKTSLNLYIINSLLGVYFQAKDKNIKRYIPYSIYMVFGVLSHYFITFPWLNTLISVIIIFCLTMNFVAINTKRVIFTVIWSAFIILVEVVVAMAYMAILQYTVYDVVYSETINTLCVITCVLISLIAVKTIETLKKSKFSDKISVFDSLYVIVVPFCSIIILLILIFLSLVYTISHAVIISLCALIVFINIFFFTLFDKLRTAERLKYELALLKNQAEYYSTIEQNVNTNLENMRIIRHDMKYHLLYLKSKIEDKHENSLEEIRKTIDSLISDVEENNLVAYTENNVINKLLNYKLFTIDDIEIEFDVKVSVGNDVYIDEISLYAIIGNLIDNAIRNFKTNGALIDKIIIRVINDSGNLFIKITNPYLKKLVFKNELPITDKNDKLFHGIGLKSVKTLVENKGGYFKIKTDNNLFTVEILLYDEVKQIKL